MLGDWAEVSLDVGHTSTFGYWMVKDIINRVVLDSVNLVHVNLILGRAFSFSRPGPSGARGFEAVFGSHLFGFNSNGAVMHHGDWDNVRCTLSGLKTRGSFFDGKRFDW